MNDGKLKILIVAEHASAKFGGEAILPLHYFRVLRSKGIDVHLCVHDRTREELTQTFPDDRVRLHFIPDTWFNVAAWKLGRFLPARLADATLGFASRFSTQLVARRFAKRLVKELEITVVHQPIPVSPREPSLLFGLGAPVIIGPMNGNMAYPPGVPQVGGARLQDSMVNLLRSFSVLLHYLMPGKLQAAVLLVANPRTQSALPRAYRGRIRQLVENGVDLSLWKPRVHDMAKAGGATNFIFVGRLVDWKRVDLLLEAFAIVKSDTLPHLQVVGDGPMRSALEEQARRLGIFDRITFLGWRPQHECARLLIMADVLVLPSTYECGGAVVLEAMACGLPVIATAWGGPADYLDPDCGMLVEPESKERLVDGIAVAIKRLNDDSSLRYAMGQAGRTKVQRLFDWEAKADCILETYREALTDPQ